MFNNAVWIGASEQCASPIISRRFKVTEEGMTELYITGLGYFEVRVNGRLITADRFIPVQSDYEKRNTAAFYYPIHDTMTYRIYYYHYDISSLVKEGKNLLEIQLGNGWYIQTERCGEGKMSYGDRLKAIYRIQAGEKTMVSDGTETWRSSQIIYNNLFVGEVHDAQFTDNEEKPVEVLEAPVSELSEAIGTPDKVIRKITPKCIAEVDGKKIYDAGENISGVVRVSTHAAAGEKIVLRFAEVLNEDKSLNFTSTGANCRRANRELQIQEDTFICDGKENIFEPKFVWHAFRYFEVSGDIDDVKVLVIHSACEVTSQFESTSEGMNFLYETFIRTQLNNMHGSIPSDCPHRERLGYTGDGQVACQAAMTMLDTQEFYRKWIQDILDCQDIEYGHVQHTAPLLGGGGGPGGWGCAIVLVPYQYYKQFGEIEMLDHCFEPMCRWIKYLLSRMENGLVVREEEKGWCLGDWSTLEKCAIPEPYVNTYYFIKSVRIMKEIAHILGEYDMISYLEKLDAKSCEAMLAAFCGEDGHFCGGIQGADAYAVDIELGGAEHAALLAADLAAKYDTMGHFDTGFLGTSVLVDVLFCYGYQDVVFKLWESELPGSFLHMKRRGATTIWEHWTDEKQSHNHPMFGGCSYHLFQSILGITQEKGSIGYDKLVIAPKVPQMLEKVNGIMRIPLGEVSVTFEQRDGRCAWYIVIPEKANAIFRYGKVELKLKEGKHHIRL